MRVRCVMVLGLAALAACGKEEAPGPRAGTDGRFGMHLQPQLRDRRAEAFDAMEDLGVSWVRTSVFWGNLEPKPGTFDWTDLDALVEDAGRRGFRLLCTVRGISPWGSRRMPDLDRKGYHASSPPKDPEAYAAFFRALAGRYRGKGIAWQVDNEPNARAFWDGTREEYVALLKAAFKAAHEADPDATVVAAGLACGFSRLGGARREEGHKLLEAWFNDILDSKAYDALDLHDYYPVDGENPWGVTFEGYLEMFEGWRGARGVKAPLWISEAGVPSAPIDVGGRRIPFTPEGQARDLERIYDLALKHGVARVFWLKLVDAPEQVFSTMGLGEGMGAGRRKPAWEAYRRLARGGRFP